MITEVKTFKRVRGEYHAGPVEITIWPDRKTGKMPDGSAYPPLYRTQVPSLTDEEWYSAPNENWDEAQASR